jgi:protein SCO1
MKKVLLFIIPLIFMFAGAGYGHDTLLPTDAGSGAIGINEKTGQYLPQDLSFHDEKGGTINLGELLGKPVILTLVYYTCDRICPFLLSGLAQAIPRLDMAIGRDYRIVTVSFDDTDSPGSVRAIKRNYLTATGMAVPEGGWSFLLGDQKNIEQLTEAVGFRFRRVTSGFDHPVVLIFLSPDGKISKYLYVTKYSYGTDYPISFSSFDLNLALREAAQGKAVTGFRKAVLYCFSHEPPGQSKFYNFIFVVGVITLIAMVSFFIYLQRTSGKYRKSRGYNDGE